MLERMKYINNYNEEISFGAGGIYVNNNDLHDYAWGYEKKNNKIAAFSTGIVKKKVPVFIAAASAEEGLKIRNSLMEIAEKDVLSMKPGKMVIGDYYLRCYITESKKADYQTHKGYMKVNLVIVTDHARWIKETVTSFNRNIASEAVEEGKRNFDYNYDFPFDYSTDMIRRSLKNEGYAKCDFKMIIYGVASNPIVYISGHAYQVNCEIEENEYLTIDSTTKKIILTKNDGTKVNCFNLRNRDSYIFEKIAPGKNDVTWEGEFGFDIITYFERSEPLWT